MFSLEEARKILPVIRRITQEISDQVDVLIQQMEATDSSQRGAIGVLDNQINSLILLWNQKIKKLGALPKGLWLVDFEFGGGVIIAGNILKPKYSTGTRRKTAFRDGGR